LRVPAAADCGSGEAPDAIAKLDTTRGLSRPQLGHDLSRRPSLTGASSSNLISQARHSHS
jgi:hypothetical protein